MPTWSAAGRIVFDGASFAVAADRAPVVRAAELRNRRNLQSVEIAGATEKQGCAEVPAPGAEPGPRWCWACATTSARTAFPGAIIGLSGGVDSALVLAIAVDALGADRVRAVMMPSPYTADISWIDARDMAERLGVRYDEMSIAPMFDAFRASLAQEFAGPAEDATEENIQARIRGTLLMALSEQVRRHRADHRQQERDGGTGYCTLYGDMAGGFAVIGDVAKTPLPPRQLALHARAAPTAAARGDPERIVTARPAAELRPDQTDQDSLPPYEVLDAILQALHGGGPASRRSWRPV